VQRAGRGGGSVRCSAGRRAAAQQDAAQHAVAGEPRRSLAIGASPPARTQHTTHTDGMGPELDRLRVAVLELRFRPSEVACAAPCLLTFELDHGATPQRIQLIDVTRCTRSGGSAAEEERAVDSSGGECDCAGEPVEGVPGARLLAVSPQLIPGSAHTFKIGRPGEMRSAVWKHVEVCCSVQLCCGRACMCFSPPCTIIVPHAKRITPAHQNSAQALTFLPARCSHS